MILPLLLSTPQILLCSYKRQGSQMKEGILDSRQIALNCLFTCKN